jgi:hypothetical protein
MIHNFHEILGRNVRYGRTCTIDGLSCTDIGGVMDYFQVCSFYFSLLFRADEICTIEVIFAILFYLSK